MNKNAKIFIVGFLISIIVTMYFVFFGLISVATENLIIVVPVVSLLLWTLICLSGLALCFFSRLSGILVHYKIVIAGFLILAFSLVKAIAHMSPVQWLTFTSKNSELFCIGVVYYIVYETIRRICNELNSSKQTCTEHSENS